MVWSAVGLCHGVEFLVAQIDRRTGDDSHGGGTANILMAGPVFSCRGMALRDPLMRLVAGIIKPERVCVVRFPLDDVTGFCRRDFSDSPGIIRTGLWVAVVEEDDVSVPCVAGDLDWALPE